MACAARRARPARVCQRRPQFFSIFIVLSIIVENGGAPLLFLVELLDQTFRRVAVALP